MSDKFKCPYCDFEHYASDNDVWELEPDQSHAFECNGCEKGFMIYLEYEPAITVQCADGQHELVEYWSRDKWSPKKEHVQSKYPSLAAWLWCKNCHYSEKKSVQT